MKIYDVKHFTEFSETELKGRWLMGQVFERGHDDDEKRYGMAERVFAKTFMIYWGEIVPADEIREVTQYLQNVIIDEHGTKRTLRRLVRDGYLYSERKHGKQYYGINYDSPLLKKFKK